MHTTTGPQGQPPHPALRQALGPGVPINSAQAARVIAGSHVAIATSLHILARQQPLLQDGPAQRALALAEQLLRHSAHDVLDAARWRAVEPLLTLDDDTAPTETRIAAMVTMRAPGCLPNAAAVVDSVLEGVPCVS